MTNIFTLLLFIVIQLRVEQQLIQKYYPSKMNLQQSCPKCGSLQIMKCGSLQIIKNGSTHNAKPKCQCKECGRQFVLNPSQKRVSDETKQLIDMLLLERIS